MNYAGNTPFAIFTNQFCPCCQALLEPRQIVKVVNSESPEAKDFDFSCLDGGRFRGDVEFTFWVYYCKNCDREYTEKERVNYYKSLSAKKKVYKAGIFYLRFKKHYCPQCGAHLERAYSAKLIDSNSEKIKKYDLTFKVKKKQGKIELRFGKFHCLRCNFEISFDDMKILEKEKRRTGNRRVHGGFL
jgi:DNA-directed RNA polymerase subunit M/transcription elongation factor TFIIS